VHNASCSQIILLILVRVASATLTHAKLPRAAIDLQQLVDSAFPSVAGSFVWAGNIGQRWIGTPQTLEAFLQDYLDESAIVDTWACRQAYRWQTSVR
jgi:urease accessory protein UreF